MFGNMNWVTVIWSMGGGACLTLALMQLVVWWKDRTARANLVLSVMAVSVAAIAAFELTMMRADTPGQFGMLMRWTHVPVFVLVVCLVIFVRLYFRTGRFWLGYAALAARFVSLILNLILLSNANYPAITRMAHVEFLGERISVAEGVHSGLAEVEVGELSSLLLLAFVVDASIALWRRRSRDGRRRALVVGGSIAVFIVIAAGFAALIHERVIHLPYIISLPFLAVVAAMGYELSCDALRVRRDLDERLRLEGLVAAVGAAFVNVTPYRVNEEIERWMQHMIASLDADRITLFEFTMTDHEVLARNTHQVAREGVPRLPREFSYDQLSWYLGELRAGRPVVLSDLTEELPAEAAAEREFAREYGTRAVMGFPLMVSGTIVRAIACVVIRKARVWSEAAQNTLRSIGQIFARALAERQAEIALRESEQHFRIVADSAPVLIWMSGVDKLCNFFNKPWLEFTGRTMEQEMGNGWAEGVHPDDFQSCLKTYDEAFDARQPFVMQYRLRRHDGEYRWISDNGVPRYDAQKNFAGYIGSCVDITELIKKKQDLRESEERMSLAAEAANLALWEWNPNTDEVWGSKTRRALLGLPASGKLTLQDAISRVVHVDDRDRLRQTLKDAARTGKDYECEYRVILPNGSVRWMEQRGRCMAGADGKTVVTRGISIDVTQRKQAEDLFRLATEASPSGIVLVNDRGRIVFVNNRVEELFGYRREELVGKLVEILVPERFASEHPAHRAQFLAAPTARPMGASRELFGRRKDGSEFPIEIGLNPIQTPDGMLVLAAVVDISARKFAEAEALQHQAQLGHLSRVAVMGELAASIAHELNQPLSGIISNASAGQRFIDRGNVDLRELRELLADIVADGRRAGSVISTFRGMIKKGDSARQRVNLNDLVTNVVRMLNSDAMLHSCTLETLLDPHLPAIGGDPTQLQQVLLNLVINAFDAMRDTPLSSRKVVIATEQNGDGAICASVRDYGTGIPGEARERLFDHFFTTKAEGLGMGLGIVRSIVESHGGTIVAENIEGGGARFSFTIPAKAAASK
jgi:PAS domain S-box-containing protein